MLTRARAFLRRILGFGDTTYITVNFVCNEDPTRIARQVREAIAEARRFPGAADKPS